MNEREFVIEIVALLAASPTEYAQREAVRLAQRYRETILAGSKPMPEAEIELAVEAMGGGRAP